MKDSRFLKIYKTLYKNYGPQKWWPTTLEKELHPTYHGKKLNKKQQFEIIVGAVLTQNTSWKNVEKAITNLNKNKLLSIDKIKKISLKKLAQLIKPSGYYNQKAERLKIIANFFLKTKNPSREQLLNVKGVGPETADSILLYALNKPFFVIDLYTRRIFTRLGLCKEDVDYHELQSLFTNNLPKETFKEYHALLVELAKNHCRTKPVCNNCPLKDSCMHKI